MCEQACKKQDFPDSRHLAPSNLYEGWHLKSLPKLNDDQRLTAKIAMNKTKYASRNLQRNMYPDVHM